MTSDLTFGEEVWRKPHWASSVVKDDEPNPHLCGIYVLRWWTKGEHGFHAGKRYADQDGTEHQCPDLGL